MRLKLGPAVVREWDAADAEALARQANDRRVSIHLRDAFPYPYAIADARQFIGMAIEKSPRTFFAIEAEGRVAGGIGYALQTDVERVGAEVRGRESSHPYWPS